MSFASGSVLLWWVALERFSPLKSTIPVPSTVLMIRSAIEVLYGSGFPARALGRVGQGTDEFRVLCVDA